DDQVHVWVLPVEPRDGPFDQDLLRLIEHGLAVMSGRRRAERHGRCEKTDSRRVESHGETSEQAIMRMMINEFVRQGIPCPGPWCRASLGVQRARRPVRAALRARPP